MHKISLFLFLIPLISLVPNFQLEAALIQLNDSSILRAINMINYIISEKMVPARVEYTETKAPIKSEEISLLQDVQMNTLAKVEELVSAI